MNEIFVNNTNDFDHEDYYDGKHYVFPAGEKVLVPVPAAIHMLGFNRKDKTENLVRLGWANGKPGEEPDAGVKKLAKFLFTVPMLVEQPVEELPPETEQPVASAA